MNFMENKENVAKQEDAVYWQETRPTVRRSVLKAFDPLYSSPRRAEVQKEDSHPLKIQDVEFVSIREEIDLTVTADTTIEGDDPLGTSNNSYHTVINDSDFTEALDVSFNTSAVTFVSDATSEAQSVLSPEQAVSNDIKGQRVNVTLEMEGEFARDFTSNEEHVLDNTFNKEEFNVNNEKIAQPVQTIEDLDSLPKNREANTSDGSNSCEENTLVEIEDIHGTLVHERSSSIMNEESVLKESPRRGQISAEEDFDKIPRQQEDVKVINEPVSALQQLILTEADNILEGASEKLNSFQEDLKNGSNVAEANLNDLATALGKTCVIEKSTSNNLSDSTCIGEIEKNASNFQKTFEDVSKGVDSNEENLQNENNFKDQESTEKSLSDLLSEKCEGDLPTNASKTATFSEEMSVTRKGSENKLPNTVTTSPNNDCTEVDNKQGYYLKDRIACRPSLRSLRQNTQIIANPLMVKPEAVNAHLEKDLYNLRTVKNQQEQDILRCTMENKADRETVKELETLVKDYEEFRQKQDKELAHRHKLYKTQAVKMNATEMAFSELLLKYDQAKIAIKGYQRNEEILHDALKKIEEELPVAESQLKQAEAQYAVRLEEEEKKIKVEEEMSKQKLSKLQTILKMLEIKASSLETALKQKTDECQALSALCDEMTGRN